MGWAECVEQTVRKSFRKLVIGTPACTVDLYYLYHAQYYLYHAQYYLYHAQYYLYMYHAQYLYHRYIYAYTNTMPMMHAVTQCSPVSISHALNVHVW